MSEEDPRAGTQAAARAVSRLVNPRSWAAGVGRVQVGCLRVRGSGAEPTGQGRGEEAETLTPPLPCGSEGKSAVSQSCQAPSQALQVSPAEARKLTARLQA